MSKLQRKTVGTNADAQLARTNLEKVGRYLAGAAIRALPIDKPKLAWASECIAKYLAGKAPTLDAAFGVRNIPGTPGGKTVWAERAELADRHGWSVKQVADHFGLSDAKSVKDGLARGRDANHKAMIEAVSREIGNQLAAAREAEQLERVAAVRKFNIEHGIQQAKKRRHGG